MTLQDPHRFRLDTALVSAIGRRAVQEDMAVGHFPPGGALGYVVLADGMGGHAAGDVASRIVVQEVCAELAAQTEDPARLERSIGAVLRQVVTRANDQVARLAASRPELRGMGSTLLVPLILRNRLYWVSVGDSPLYLLRGDRMTRLNQEHSMIRHLDRMVAQGLISARDALAHPDRFCLTSALLGAPVPEIDCRDRPIDLLEGDILIAASDGILSLDEPQIAALIYAHRDSPCAAINDALLADITQADDPDQDNVTLCLVKIGAPAAALTPAVSRGTAPRTTVRLQIRRSGNRVIRSFSSVSDTEGPRL